MGKDLGVYDPEQLTALQKLFDRLWVQLSHSKLEVTDWTVVRDKLAVQVMECAQNNFTENEIVQAVLSSLGLL
jgi:hypothetical protein